MPYTNAAYYCSYECMVEVIGKKAADKAEAERDKRLGIPSA
jgi:hypothetical protein